MLRLWNTFKEKKKRKSLLKAIAFREFGQSLLSPHLFSPLLSILRLKKGKEGFLVVLLFWFYGFFLSKSKPTMAIAMIITITAATIPIVRLDCDAKPVTGGAVGAVVGAGGLA